MDTSKSKKILTELEQGYDLIADKFSSTRVFMWRDLEFLKDYIGPGDKVLDFGCGNGRLVGFLENDYQELVGVDISQKLIDTATEKYSNEKTKFFKVDPELSKLPFEDNSFDVIFSIAVFHHLPSKDYRLQMAKELYRVLRPQGKLIVSVWNLWQKRFWRYHLKELGRSGLDWGDLYVPFKAGNRIFDRYHHAFRKRELVSLFHKAGFKKTDLRKNWNMLYIGHK